VGATSETSTFPNNSEVDIFESATTLSDLIVFGVSPLLPSNEVQVDFSSDSEAILPALGNCGNPNVQCVTEDGTIQTAGTITWSNGTNCSDSGTTCIVDTVQFQSDVEPEPGTLVLFGSGLISIVGFARRKLFLT
jgi:hypothetical protein